MALAINSLNSVLDFVLPRLRKQKETKQSPFVLGLTGLQGSGKSTWAATLKSILEQSHQLKVVNISLDDLYEPHASLVRIRRSSDNPLLRTRGQPGTHDEQLAAELLASLHAGKAARLPSFDKSKFNGEGDRVPKEEWQYIPSTPLIDVIIFEGWCIGFRALDPDCVRHIWEQAKAKAHAARPQQRYSTETLATLELQHICEINRNLRVYNDTFMGPETFDVLVHIDTDDLTNVYRWRIEQEHATRRAKGQGLSDDAVIDFVRGYMPSYELYLDQLRRQGFAAGGHLRVVLDADRNIVRLEVVEKGAAFAPLS